MFYHKMMIILLATVLAVYIPDPISHQVLPSIYSTNFGSKNSLTSNLSTTDFNKGKPEIEDTNPPILAAYVPKSPESEIYGSLLFKKPKVKKIKDENSHLLSKLLDLLKKEQQQEEEDDDCESDYDSEDPFYNSDSEFDCDDFFDDLDYDSDGYTTDEFDSYSVNPSLKSAMSEKMKKKIKKLASTWNGLYELLIPKKMGVKKTKKTKNTKKGFSIVRSTDSLESNLQDYILDLKNFTSDSTSNTNSIINTDSFSAYYMHSKANAQIYNKNSHTPKNQTGLFFTIDHKTYNSTRSGNFTIPKFNSSIVESYGMSLVPGVILPFIFYIFSS